MSLSIQPKPYFSWTPGYQEDDSSLSINNSIRGAFEAVASFFQPSPEDLRFQSEVQYPVLLTSSDLLKVMMLLREEGGYKGVGINKNQLLRHSNLPHGEAKCDIAYFAKRDDQLAYEQGEWNWLRLHFGGSEIEERQKKQKRIIQTIEMALQRHLHQSRYEAFVSPLSTPSSHSFFTTKDRFNLDAFILIHKKDLKRVSAPHTLLGPIYNRKIVYAAVVSDHILFLFRNQGDLELIIYNIHTNETSKISEIDTPFPYQSLSNKQLVQCLNQAYLRIAPLSDKTFKLYIVFRLLGGMMQPGNRARCMNLGIGDPIVSDAVLADRIIAAIGRYDVYSSVRVHTLEHSFSEFEPPKQTRFIKASIGNWAWFVHLMEALVTQPIRGINENRAVAAILGSQKPEDVKEMVRSYKKNYSFNIYVSYDLNNFYFAEASSDDQQEGPRGGVLDRLRSCVIS